MVPLEEEATLCQLMLPGGARSVHRLPIRVDVGVWVLLSVLLSVALLVAVAVLLGVGEGTPAAAAG